MADTKITALAAITTVDPAADVLPIVDISDTSMAASGTTKKVTSNQILGAGGTATLASATITGDLTVDTNVLKVDTTLNRVGIGTASPAYPLSVAGRISYSSGIGEGADLTVSSSSTTLQFGLGSSWVAQSFYISGSTAMTLNSTGLNIANGNVILGTSGKGIDFSATPGTGTSELLNDYEEGTWDAAFATTGGTVTISAAENNCRYTKIGRVVTVNGYISVSSVSSPTGALTITNLPFQIAAGSEANAYSAAAVAANGLETTATGQIVGFGAANTTSISLLRYELGNQVNLASGVKANSVFIFSLTYSV